MPRKKARREPPEVYQLYISLEEIKPRVWRRVLVSSTATLAQLHALIQGSFRWVDKHLHNFDTITGGLTSPAFEQFIADVPDMRPYTRVQLCQVLPALGSHIEYTYDYRDGWDHMITLEQRLSAVPGMKYPAVIAGARRGPMDGCGGSFAYMKLVDIMNEGAKDEEEHEVIEQHGRFEPEEFDLEECNKRLALYCRQRVLWRLPAKEK